jgi:uncharacterized protein
VRGQRGTTITIRTTRICALLVYAVTCVPIALYDVGAADIGECNNQALLKTEPVRVATACQHAAAQGNAEAQVRLGDLYVSGQGVPRDYAQAAVWFRRSAQQNNATGQMRLGELYDYGHGVPRDYELAYIWYNLAATRAGASGNDLLQMLAAAFRDSAAQHLAPAQVADAQRRSSAWRPGAEP